MSAIAIFTITLDIPNNVDEKEYIKKNYTKLKEEAFKSVTPEHCRPMFVYGSGIYGYVKFYNENQDNFVE